MRTQGNLWVTVARLLRGILKGRQLCFIGKNVKLGKNLRLSPLVLIDDNVVIGDNTFVGFGCVIRPKTVIGRDCSFGHLSVVEGAKIGNRVAFHAQCHITMGTVVEDDVFVGPLYVSTNTKRINFNRDFQVPLEGPTIKRAARIGGGVGLTPGIVIGENALIGAGSLVTKDVPAREIWFGSPAKKRGDVIVEETL